MNATFARDEAIAATDEKTSALKQATAAFSKAEHAATRASRAREEAEKLIEFMAIDLRDKLAPVGRLSLLDNVNRRVQNYYDSFGVEQQSSEILRRRSVILTNRGDVQRARVICRAR